MSDLFDLTREAVHVSAHRTTTAYQAYVTLGDVVNTLWAWVYGETNTRKNGRQSNEDLVRSWLESEEVDYKLGMWRLNRQLDRVGQRYARIQKAAIVGYNPPDEFFYDKGIVEALLPMVWYDGEPSVEKPEGQDADTPRNKKDPAEGGDLLAMISDVRFGFARLGAANQRILTDRFGYKLSVKDMAEDFGVSVSTTYARIGRALDRLVDNIGGPNPW